MRRHGWRSLQPPVVGNRDCQAQNKSDALKHCRRGQQGMICQHDDYFALRVMADL